MWLECNCLMFLSPCICLSLFCTCWEDAYNGAVFFSFLVRSRSCFCPLVVGILKKKKKKNVDLLHSFVRNLLTLLPPFSLSLSLSPSLSFSLPICWQKCMHAYGVRCRQGCWYNRFVSSLCFETPPVSLTACHFRQIFQSVTFLQKWNHRTLWE